MEQNDKNKAVAGSRRAYKISAKRVKVTGILLLAIVFVALLLMSPIFKIKSIVVQKEGNKNTELIIKELGFSKGDNIFSVDINKAIDRIEKIESDKTLPHPDEVMAMAQCYKMPSMCNHYCSNECPIGKEYVPEIKEEMTALCDFTFHSPKELEQFLF